MAPEEFPSLWPARQYMAEKQLLIVIATHTTFHTRVAHHEEHCEHQRDQNISSKSMKISCFQQECTSTFHLTQSLQKFYFVLRH
jgi:hypothetical protein